jgi:hypothetical protein
MIGWEVEKCLSIYIKHIYILEEVVMAVVLSEGTEETNVKSPSTIPTHS